MATTNTTPGLKRLRKSAKAETVRKATLADQKLARAAAKARATSTTPAKAKNPPPARLANTNYAG